MGGTGTATTGVRAAGDLSPAAVGTRPVPVSRARGRLPANVAANLAAFAVNAAATASLTPYLIHHVGISAYGLVALIGSATLYLGLFSVAINSGLGRYVTIGLERGDRAEANQYFNTGLMAGAALVALLVVPLLWLTRHLGALVSVPEGSLGQARLLLIYISAVFAVSTIAAPFEVASFSRNRLDLRGVISVSATMCRVLLVVALFNVYVPRMWHYGLASVAAAVLSLAGSLWVWRRLTPELHLRPLLFSLRHLRSLAGLGLWVVVNQMGTLLFLNVDLIVANRVLGASTGGQYAAVAQSSTVLRGLAATIAAAFFPTMLFCYARGDTAGLVRYSRRAVRIVGCAIALPLGLVCGLSGPVLRLWLGEAFAPLAPLLSLMTAHLCLNLPVMPLFGLQTAANRVRLPAAVTCVLGAASVTLAVVLAGRCGLGVYGIALASAIVLTAKNALFTPAYAARIVGAPTLTFAREMALAAGLALNAAVISWLLARLLDVTTWSEAAAIAAIALLAHGLACYALALTGEERRRLRAGLRARYLLGTK